MNAGLNIPYNDGWDDLAGGALGALEIINGRLNDMHNRLQDEVNPPQKKGEDEKNEAAQTMIDMKPFGCVRLNGSKSAVKVNKTFYLALS